MIVNERVMGLVNSLDSSDMDSINICKFIPLLKEESLSLEINNLDKALFYILRYLNTS